MVGKEEYLILFELSCADLKLVEKNLKDNEVRPQLLLFHLQQAIEKFLKSLLSFKQIKFPKVHDIGKLIELCKKNKITLPEYVEEFLNLTPYAVEFRYGLVVEDTLDVEYYYKRILEFKKFLEKTHKEYTRKKNNK